MTDIVEELRHSEVIFKLPYKGIRIMEDAADEIERLRKENEHLKRDSFRVGLGGMYFISGQSPNTDRYGFPDTITICPTYGSDVLRIYTKVEPDDKTVAKKSSNRST